MLLPLMACDTAGPGFRGVDAREVTYEGSRFTLRLRENMAEVIRTSPEMLPRFENVARRAAIATQIETGCHAAWVEGDPAMMLIGLSCDGERPPKRPKRPRMLYCDLIDLQGRGGLLQGSMTCFKS
ncbi:hypothetical protein [Tropicibacter oceani]|uniref:Lipoprotein n=1 Tax=Tropicibacter oceani TaxID=3058420 RepID=A0ABY8QHX8_9RHOB|nr:hypothetical protein [Tropicibacter oceani]WGW04244.1 hypothetical protein QF118_01525 [Tropicibacter oceani]